eukprot:CAMPEP_0174742632 /NCGR_PEP_ID=MMETSP1094-20130205/79459_1 /TAXON_ID=156173 /ORGANISM="Chrysochromulina brevifilum, Strain UTEX LB 985" /LENGTH=40 /DNA_ID= /DNA_START= /DNA_END= /DNA_ORIENTATION=
MSFDVAPLSTRTIVLSSSSLPFTACRREICLANGGRAYIG